MEKVKVVKVIKAQIRQNNHQSKSKGYLNVQRKVVKSIKAKVNSYNYLSKSVIVKKPIKAKKLNNYMKKQFTKKKGTLKEQKIEEIKNTFINQRKQMKYNVLSKSHSIKSMLKQIEDMDSFFEVLENKRDNYAEENQRMHEIMLRSQKVQIDPLEVTLKTQLEKIEKDQRNQDFQIQIQKLFKKNLKEFSRSLDYSVMTMQKLVKKFQQEFKTKITSLKSQIQSFQFHIQEHQNKTTNMQGYLNKCQKRLALAINKVKAVSKSFSRAKKPNFMSISFFKSTKQMSQPSLFKQRDQSAHIRRKTLMFDKSKRIKSESSSDAAARKIQRDAIQKILKGARIDQKAIKIKITGNRIWLIKDSVIVGTFPKNKVTTLTCKLISNGSCKQWNDTKCFLIGSSIRKENYQLTFNNLKQRTGFSPFYGVYDSLHKHCNLKVKKGRKQMLSVTDCIKVIFNPMQKTVNFSSKNFEYYHDNIERDDYQIVIGLLHSNAILEVNILSVQ